MNVKNTIARMVQKLSRISGLPGLVQTSSNSLRNDIKAYLDEVIADKWGILADIGSRNAQVAGSYVDKGTQVLLGMKYREAAANGIRMPFGDVEFRNHSQTGEDGILWYIFSLLGTTNKVAVEMCAGVGFECNTANLIVNHGWHGLLFDGDTDNISKGQAFFGSHPDTRIVPPSMIKAWITAENVNELIEDTGATGEIDLFSLDVDGVDYWIWDALTIISPRVIILEFQAAWGCESAVTVPYKPDFVAEWHVVDESSGAVAQYGGASLLAFVKLAKRKGYRLVGTNSLGYNAFFVRDDLGKDILPEVGAADCFTHPVANWANVVARELFETLEWEEV
jgi:hypothetical protein